MARRDVFSEPAIAVRLTLPDGEVLERSWTMKDVPRPGFVNDVLPWVTNQRKSWPSPQSPITYSADVKPEHVDDVRRWLDA